MTQDSFFNLAAFPLFCLWDGKSRGTLANLGRLIELGKKAVVYVAPLKEFRTLRSSEDREHFVSLSAKNARPRAPQPSLSAEWQPRTARQDSLF